jgi:transcriptional regulator with XRE-family HTH domain
MSRRQSGLLVDAAALLRSHLQSIGMSQHELAKRVGRTEKHVSQVLTGKARAVDIDRWAILAGATLYVHLVPFEPDLSAVVSALL